LIKCEKQQKDNLTFAKDFRRTICLNNETKDFSIIIVTKLVEKSCFDKNCFASVDEIATKLVKKSCLFVDFDEITIAKFRSLDIKAKELIYKKVDVLQLFSK